MASRSSPIQSAESLRQTRDTELRGSGNYDSGCFGDPMEQNESSSDMYLIGGNLVLHWKKVKAF